MVYFLKVGSYLPESTPHLLYENQSENDVYGNDCFLLREPNISYKLKL
jgi:hypothetical protein